MGVFDYYCALCCGPLGAAGSGEIGSSAPSALARRRRRVERRRLAKMSGQEFESSDEDGSDMEDADVVDGGDETQAGGDEGGEDALVADTSESNVADIGNQEDAQEEEEWFCDQEDETYDPTIVNRQDLAWLLKFRCLGFNASATGSTNAFISGDASYQDDGWAELAMGTDPNQPEEKTSFECYTPYNADEIPVYPMHDNCIQLLGRVFGSPENTDNINRDVLYGTMASLSWQSALPLSVSYGDISGPDQCWESIPGEEFSVINPILTAPIMEAFHTRLSQSELQMPTTVAANRRHTVQDPFCALSRAIISRLAHHLDSKSLLSLATASWPILSAARDDALWKRRVIHDMPWAWELHEILHNEQYPTLHYKSLCLWLDHLTKFPFGMKGPFTGLANRRRIWEALEQIVAAYSQRLQQMPSQVPDAHIVNHSICIQMPIVSFSSATETSETQRTFFIHDWDELDNQASVFEAHWDPSGALVGLGVAFGNERRVFGTHGTSDSQIKNTAIYIGPKEWPVSMRLYIPDVKVVEHGPTTAIHGIAITMTGRKTVCLGDCKSSNAREFTVSKDAFFVGFTGYVNSSGIITRIGLLQCPRPQQDNVYSPPPEPSLGQLLLWQPTAGETSSKRLIVLASPAGLNDQHMSDLCAHDTIVWAKDQDELQKLERVSLRIHRRVQGSAGIVGLRAQFIKRCWEPKRYVGIWSRNPEGDSIDSAEDVLHFDVDGPGGERITKVAVSCSTKPRAIKLQTNTGRTIIAGSTDETNWKPYQAQLDEYIVGLVLALQPKLSAQAEPEIASLIVMVKSSSK